jgi:hypothetical protein
MFPFVPATVSTTVSARVTCGASNGGVAGAGGTEGGGALDVAQLARSAREDNKPVTTRTL